MKRIAGLVALLSIIALTAAVAQPKITVVDGTDIDFGDVYQGQKIDRKVTIKNTGDKQLVIDNVQAGCGCTATLLAERNLDPGKTTSLQITFDSKNFWGPTHKDVRVFSNDSAQTPLMIKFSANVLQVLTPNPTYFYFLNGKIDSTMTSTIKLKNASKERIKILEVKSDIEQSAFKLKDKDLKPGEETELTATFTPAKLGYVSRDVTIKTTHPKQPELTIKLFCNVTREK